MEITDDVLEAMTSEDLEALQYRAQDILTRRLDLRGIPSQVAYLVDRYGSIGGNRDELIAGLATNGN